MVKADEIRWIGAAGNYAEIHVSGKSVLLRETMSSLEGRLDPARFARIHRSTIVNVDRVKELFPALSGEYEVILDDGTRLSLGRSYRERLRGRLGGIP